MDDVLVLWDIDGTLLNAGGVGRDLYDVVFSQLFGRSLSAYAPMAGRTDRAIILETLVLAGVDEPRRYVDPFIAGLGAHASSVRTAVEARGRALPGAAEVLAALASAHSLGSLASIGVGQTGLAGLASGPVGGGPRADGRAGTVDAPAGARVPVGVGSVAAGTAGTVLGASAGVPAPQGVPGRLRADGPSGADGGTGVADGFAAGGGVTAIRVHQSVLTGNIRSVAEMKLAALGLREGLDLCIGAYGDDHEDRTELVQVARRRAAAVHGRTPAAFDGTSTVVVGDTPLDILAALAADARAVGVATGTYPAAELTAAGAHAVLPDLTDTTVVLSALLDC